MKHTALVGVASLVALAASPAFAQTVVTAQPLVDDGSVTKVVHFGDLNIATAAGQKTLIRRVRGAVKHVCLYATDLSTTASCESYAWNGARPEMTRALALARTDPTLAMGTLATLTVSAPR